MKPACITACHRVAYCLLREGMLTGPDGIARTPSPYLEVLTKRLDAFPNERWLPAVLPVNLPHYPARIQSDDAVYWRVGRTVHRGETLPCFADKHGCLVAERSEGNCHLAPAFEYLAQSRGAQYLWHPLSVSQTTGKVMLLRERFSGTKQIVIVGHRMPNQRLLAARAIHYGMLVLGYLAVDETGFVVGGGKVTGCDPRAAHHSAVVTAQHDVKVCGIRVDFREVFQCVFSRVIWFWCRVDIAFAVRLVVRCNLRTTAHRCDDRVICARFLGDRKLRLPGIDKFLQSVGGGYKVAVNEAGLHVVSVAGLIGERRVALLIVFQRLCIAHEACPLETLVYGIGLSLPP
ncbi:hypothetical protein MRX96_040702 [Rhipicephalus microplus]